MEDLNRAPAEAAIARWTSLKALSDFNNYSVWKHKVRENCYRRVPEDRGRLLWRMRLPGSEPCTSKVMDGFNKISELFPGLTGP